MIQELLGLPGIFTGDAIDAAQHIESAKSDVAEIADGSGD
jgi:hypothetical protein